MNSFILLRLLKEGTVDKEIFGKELNPEPSTLLKVSRDYEVPGVAGYSNDGKTLYIDKRVPSHLNGILIDTFLVIHEAVEKTLRDQLGYEYDDAHEIALAAERRAVLNSGLDWDAYDAFMNKEIDKYQDNADPAKQPPDLQVVY